MTDVTLHLFFVVVALVLFILEGLGVPSHPRFNFIGWGLFALTCALFLVR